MLCLLSSLGAGCGDPNERAIEGARGYFEREIEATDPSWASLFGYMHRRFGLTAHDAAGRALHLAPAQANPTDMQALYLRLDDPNASVAVERIAALPSVVDRMTAAALHCDRIPLPDDWPTILARASEVGGYALTHAALAGQWTLENECLEWADLVGLQHAQIAALEAMVADPDRLVAEFDTPLDLRLEGMAMLAYLGAATRIRPEWVAEIRLFQRPDGGWPVHPSAPRSDPHPTALALWVMLEQRSPAAERIRWVAERPL